MKTVYSMAKTAGALLVTASVATVVWSLWRNGTLNKILSHAPFTGMDTSEEDAASRA